VDEEFHGFSSISDSFSRTCLAIHAEQSIKDSDVVSVMDLVVRWCRQTPKRIQVDNGSEFISKALDLWTYENKVILDFSRPGKPTDNPYIDSLNGSFRDVCLNLLLTPKTLLMSTPINRKGVKRSCQG